MSITSIDQNFITNDDDYLFTFLNNEVSNSLEYSSTNSESSSPQVTSSSSPENCSWDLFEFESDFLPQVKKEDKFSNSSCFSNLYPSSLAGNSQNETKANKETGKKRTFDDLLGEPDVKCQTKLENSQIPPNLPRTISIEEEKKLKKQRRLIKNRESAQLSRLRKKQYIENLENQVKKLANENAILNKHIETVQTQNLALQEEVLYLRGVINQNKQDPNLTNLKARNTATAGVCLLLILFSFGLFFNQSQNPSSSSLALPTAPSVPQTFYKGLTLKEQPPPPLPEPPKNDQSSLQPQSNNELDPKPKRAKIQVINEEEDDLVISPTRASTFSSSPPPNAISSLSGESNLKPSNNSYIYCPEAHQFINEDSTASSENFEFPVISLLLPSVSLNGILPEINEHISNPEQTLLEVSCKILNINVYPFFPDVSSGSFVPPIAIGSL